MITGIVLAAGRSQRMGRTKALLDANGRSFLASAVEVLRSGGCHDVVAVVRAEAEAVAREAAAAEATVVRNDRADAEQIDSLRLGLQAAGLETTAAIVLPVDHPRVSADTVSRLAAAHRRSPDAVIRPVVDHRPGHPTLFPRSVWPQLFRDPLPDGARTVVEAAGTRRVDVPVTDPGVLLDIDTPDQYDRLAGGGP